MTVAVVGAGITGLSTAYLLLREGVPTTVYEAASDVGGLAASFRNGSFAFDFGPHEFCTDDPRLQRLLAEVVGDDLLQIEKRTAQHFRGRFVRYPFEVVDVLRNVGPRLCARAVVEVGLSRLRNLVRRPDDGSFEAWTHARFGRTLYETYFGPYTRKVWGRDPSLLDPRTASQRISVDSYWDLARKTLGYQFLGAEDFKRTHSEFQKSFFYVRGGIGRLQEHLRRAVVELGGEIRLEHRLSGAGVGPRGVERLTFANGAVADAFDHVVSTIPLPLLVRTVLGDEGDALVRANDLPFRGMAFVFLRVDRPRVLDYHWTYYPDEDVPFQRATEFTHFEADMCPPGQTGLALEVSCDPGEENWEADDEVLVRRCVDALAAVTPLDPSEVLGADVVRVGHAYPVQVVGFLEKSERLVGSLARFPNLVTIGRQGLFRYCNMNECMEMALDVVPSLVGGEQAIRCSTAPSWRGVGLTDRVAL